MKSFIVNRISVHLVIFFVFLIHTDGNKVVLKVGSGGVRKQFLLDDSKNTNMRVARGEKFPEYSAYIEKTSTGNQASSRQPSQFQATQPRLHSELFPAELTVAGDWSQKPWLNGTIWPNYMGVYLKNDSQPYIFYQKDGGELLYYNVEEGKWIFGKTLGGAQAIKSIQIGLLTPPATGWSSFGDGWGDFPQLTVTQSNCNDGTCCTTSSPCQLGGGPCGYDDQCASDLGCGVDNCRDHIDNSLWYEDCCTECGGSSLTCCSSTKPCQEGGGTCSSDDQCEGDLGCGIDNCMIFHNFTQPIYNIGFYDCCTVCGSTTLDCCSRSSPCLLGGGHCNYHEECADDLVCGFDTCKQFHPNGAAWNCCSYLTNRICRIFFAYGPFQTKITNDMYCSTTNVFCDPDAVAPLGEPLVVNNEGDHVLIGLASWSGSCTDGPQVKGKHVGIYHEVVSSLDWILNVVYSNGGPGTGICCRACDQYLCKQDSSYMLQLLSTLNANIDNVDEISKQTRQLCTSESEDLLGKIFEDPFFNAVYKTRKLLKQVGCQQDKRRSFTDLSTAAPKTKGKLRSNGFYIQEQYKVIQQTNTTPVAPEFIAGVLLVGGQSFSYNITALPMKDNNKTCSRTFPRMPLKMSGKHGAAMFEGELLLVCGGLSPKCLTLSVYDAAAGWRKTVEDLAGVIELHTMTTIGDSEAVGIVGGYSEINGAATFNLSLTTKTWRVLPNTTNWLPGPSLTTARYSHCTVAINSSTLVTTGGFDRNWVAMSSVELVNYEDNITTTLPEMEQERSLHGCSLVTDANSVQSIVVAGGQTGALPLTSVVQLFLIGEDVNQWKWEKLPDLPQPSWSNSLVPTIDNSGIRLFVANAKVLQLKPATNSSMWEEVPGISFDNRQHKAVPILAC